MSADRTMGTTPDHQSDTAHTTSPESTLSTKVTSENNTKRALEGTPSRVTINVKDSTFRAASSVTPHQSGEKFYDLDSYKDELANSSEPEPSTKLTSPSPHMISPPSSPSRSPEIEVAEVEDMNQEPGNTRWRPLGDVPDPVKIRDHLWAIFPCRVPSQNVLETADELTRHFHQAQSVSGIAEKTVIIFDIIHRIVDHYHLVRRDFSAAEGDAPLSRQHLLLRLYSFFQAVDSILQKFITKQVAALSHDLCEIIVCQLAILLQKITAASDDLTSRVLNEDLGLIQNFSTHSAPVIAEEAWKFRVFRKCFLEGRMEIRIQGVESMQHALVQIHRKYIQGTSTARQHPIVSFLCDFIVNNKLIDYLVGVESHPRLIRLTGNIVGFLVVSQRYTEAESDRIWETVIKSQDSGVVGAILQMLPSIFNIAHFSQLLYLVTKLNDIAVSAWDSRMTAYADQLFKSTVTKWNELQQGRSMDKAPYQCCIRLIREASACEKLAFSKRRQVSMFASTSLETLLDVGPSDDDRLQIYEDCIGDIAARSICATGSICVINILLRHDTKWEIGRLAKDFALAELVIAEFEQMISRMSQGLQDPRFFDESLNARLELLQQIIMFSPDFINTERGWNLWDTMVGSKAPSHLARDSALIMLVNATMSLRKRNSFIDACISDYLPKLPPRFFTSNILFFVTQVFQYGNFVEQIGADTECSYSDRLGIDMLWRVALVAPSNTVERKAIETLVTTYLDSPKTQGMPKAAIERMHVAVVERCVRQLATAASQLKAFTDGTSSGEDEPMVIVAPDEEVYLQRLTFCRSLLILQELVHRIRSHPSYSPVPAVRSQQYADVEEINGNPVTIHYQPFSGGSSHSIKTVQVGDLDKVRDLMQRFATLTGFPNFTVIVGGQRLNPEELNESMIRPTRLHEKGLFLIKNLHGPESVSDLTPAGLMKPLELEIMVSEHTIEVPLRLNVPVLHSKTRHNLYNILLAMANDSSEYHRLLKLVRSLLSQTEGPQAWSWGIAQTTEDCTYDPNWCLERVDTIRSSAGYAGLKNLTNTCYMNSLLTQLFMNAKFRRFMLGADITDRSQSQRLLFETKTLFAFMQRTMLKAVDTQGIADSLVNYENTLIDVSLQMDVDEFYNLLFDRWESQILSNKEKKTFRAFYGGQIVQQIKSKECPHISERLEPFSAIQCDIQGKTSLTESLSAYVGGEIMEGGPLATRVL
ncbi:MAG: hypothetical protein LQ344_005446 [Seirophora lacunosa]|nr:MAG: hypothetical protein LQ344_005446 [Seirophora lacunosa]